MTDTPAQGTTPLLEPCPFCGGAAVIKCITDTYRPDTYDWWVSCVVCTVERPSTKLSERAHRRDEAIGAWNQRAPDAERVRLIAELAESQAYILVLERTLQSRTWEPVGVRSFSTDNATLVIADEQMSIITDTDTADCYETVHWTFPANVRVCERRPAPQEGSDAKANST